MSPWSPQEAAPSPLLSLLHQSDHHGSSTPKDHRFADRKTERKVQSQTAENKKSQSPRPESTPEIKVVLTALHITSSIRPSLYYLTKMERKDKRSVKIVNEITKF